MEKLYIVEVVWLVEVFDPYFENSMDRDFGVVNSGLRCYRCKIVRSKMVFVVWGGGIEFYQSHIFQTKDWVGVFVSWAVLFWDSIIEQCQDHHHLFFTPEWGWFEFRRVHFFNNSVSESSNMLTSYSIANFLMQDCIFEENTFDQYSI